MEYVSEAYVDLPEEFCDELELARLEFQGSIQLLVNRMMSQHNMTFAQCDINVVRQANSAKGLDVQVHFENGDEGDEVTLWKETGV